MIRLPRFRYAAPRTLDEAAALLAAHGPEARLLAGGTDLLPNMKRRIETPRLVVGLRGVAGLGGVETEGEGLRLGAMLSLSRLEADEAVRRAFPALAEAAGLVSTPPLRNLGTLGGNLCLDTRCNYLDQSLEWRAAVDGCLKKDGDTCWVAPGSERCWAISSSDTAPLLCALGAEVTLVSTAGARRIPLDALYAPDGIRPLARRPDEILASVHLPPAAGRRSVYRKLRRRGSFDFPVLGVAAAVELDGAGLVRAARLYLGAVAPRPVACDEAARLLVGQRLPLPPDVTAAAAEAAWRVAKPLDNTDFHPGWRKEMTRREVTAALAAFAPD